MAKIEKIKKGTSTIYPATIPQAVVDPTSGKSAREELDEKANHGYDSAPKTLKTVDEAKVDKASIVGETGQGETSVMHQKAVTDELGTKASHGYETEPKTLKQVDDEVSQLAGDVEGTIEMPIAHALSQLKEEIDSLRILIEEGRINRMQIETLDVISEIRINGSPLIYVRDSAPSFSPDQVPQFYIDTSAGRFYAAKGTGSANDWF